MSFREYWQEQQAQKAAARKTAIEEAQVWIGRRVWCPSPFGSRPTYGEVEFINERGAVFIVIGYNDHDRPLYYQSDVQLLGALVTLAEE